MIFRKDGKLPSLDRESEISTKEAEEKKVKKKIFSLVIVLILLIGLVGLTAMPVLAQAPAITIDGTLSGGEWDDYFWFTDNSKGPGTGYKDDAVPIFTGYVTFDDKNLYLAFNVQDNTPNTNRDFLYVTIDIPPAGVFNTPVDALYWGSIPASASLFGEAYLTGDSFPWDKSQRVSTWGTAGGVVTARTITGTNRCYELKIPLAAISAEMGDTIGLKIQARGGQYLSITDPQVVNYYPDMPGGITPIRSDTRVEVEGNFYHLTLTPPNEPPVVNSVTANPGQLWPPNGKAVSVAITVDATDPDGPGDIVRTTYSVTDEYGTYNVVETDLPEDGVISLIAERDGKDKDGRVYTITVTVYDAGGLSDGGSVDVVVPHDQGKRAK